MRHFQLVAFFLTILIGLASLIIWPDIDLAVSNWFYTPGKGFLFADLPFFMWIHDLAYYGSRLLGVALGALALISVSLRRPIWQLEPKKWLFLFCALILGPVLLANVILKDHWGRPRPREVIEFGGTFQFSPAWIPQNHERKNSSFVAGDPAFGFFLSSFAYVVPRRRSERKKFSLSRIFFWSGMGAGVAFGILRITMGAHFLSDVLFAGFFMLFAIALLHALMFGRKETTTYWTHWFFTADKKAKSRS